MKITYLGHSSFLFVSGDGVRVVTDPFSGIGYPFPAVSADVVTVSHGHYDHCAVSSVGGKPAVFRRAGKDSFGAWNFTAFRSFHDDAGGRKRGENLIFRMEADGITVCHLGDVGERCFAERKEALGKIDVLLVPVGGNYTIGAAAAREYVEALRPSIVVPMHFFTPGLKIDIAGPEEFLSLFPAEDVVAAGKEISVDRETVARDRGKIYLMERV